MNIKSQKLFFFFENCKHLVALFVIKQFSLVPYIVTFCSPKSQIHGYGLAFTSYTGEDLSFSTILHDSALSLFTNLQIDKSTQNKQVLPNILSNSCRPLRHHKMMETYSQAKQQEGKNKENQSRKNRSGGRIDRGMVSKDCLSSRMHRRVLIDVCWLEPAVKRQHVEMV